MRYKVLLTGRGFSTINDFFELLNQQFQILTTSMRYNDILEHIEVFQPDILVYCLKKEIPEHMNLISSLKPVLSEHSIPLAIIGFDRDCREFKKIAGNIADIKLYKPITAGIIYGKITEYLDQKQAEQLSTERNAARKHILVIDDDPLMLKIIREHLRDKYDVATAINGKIALKFLSNKKTDLILLDYEMPMEDGPAVLEKIRQNDTTKDLPVLFLTGTTDRAKIQKALLYKPQGYLIKPVDSEQLISAIDKILQP